MKTKVFPRQIFVKRDRDGDETFLIAAEDSDGFEDGEAVAIYELKELKKKTITHALVNR